MKLLAPLLACLQMPLLAPSSMRAVRATSQGAGGRADGQDGTPADGAAPDEGDDGPTGCGWYDSSHDLACGLLVQEHLSPDSLAQELPLDAWLALHLAGWQPGRLHDGLLP